MTRVTCPCVECKHCNDKNQCKCKEIKLEHRNIQTAYEGKLDCWFCEKFELSDTARKINDLFYREFKEVDRSEEDTC